MIYNLTKQYCLGHMPMEKMLKTVVLIDKSHTIMVANELDLFEDEKDLKETIDFWKHHKRVQ